MIYKFMAEVAREDPNILDVYDLLRDKKKLNRFCEDCNFTPKTRLPVVTGGAQGVALPNPVYRKSRNLHFNAAHLHCFEAVTK